MSEEFPHSDCPDEDVLARISAGETGDHAVAEHLLTCDRCAALLREFQENEAFLTDAAPLLSARDRSRPGEITDTDSVPGYRVLGEIHRGAQGVVYKAWHEPTRTFRAIKMLLRGAFASPRERYRFEQEIEIVGRLRHPNIITVHETGVLPGGRVGYIMEFVDGVPLDQWVCSVTASRSCPREQVDRKLSVLRRIVDAMRYAHDRGIIHRDLKPANILVADDDEPRILDFGLAKAVGIPAASVPHGQAAKEAPSREPHHTQIGEICGTYAYAAPEQLVGDPGLIDTRTDVYALGVVAYELFTGVLPYPISGTLTQLISTITNQAPAPPSTTHPELKRDLETVILKALAKEPSRRYQNAGELLSDLDRFRSGGIVEARRDSRIYVLRKVAQRHRMPIAALSLLLLLLIGFAGAMTLQAGHLARERDRAELALRDSNIQRAIALARIGSVTTAEEVLWDMALLHPGRGAYAAAPAGWPAPAAAYWALTEIAASHPCVQTATSAFASVGLPVPCSARPQFALAVSGNPGRIELWSMEPLDRQRVIHAHEQFVRSIAFTGDGSLIITVCDAGEIKVWNTDGDETPVAIRASTGHLRGIATTRSPDEFLLLDGMNRLHLVSLPNFEIRRSIDLPTDDAQHVWMRADKSYIVINEWYTKRIFIVDQTDDWALRELRHPWLERNRDPLKGLTFHPTEPHLALVSGWGDLALFDMRDHRLLHSIDDVGRGGVHFAPNGDTVAVAHDIDRTIRIFPLSDPERRTTIAGHASLPHFLGFSSDGTRLLASDRDGAVKLWETRVQGWYRQLSGHSDSIFTVLVTPCGERVYSSGGDRMIVQRSAHDPHAAPMITDSGHESPILSMAMSADGSILATGGHRGDHTIRIWDITGPEPQLRQVLTGHTSHIHFLAFDPSGSRLASGGGHDDSTMRVWDLTKGAEIDRQFVASETAVYGLAWSPDGEVLAWSDGAGRIMLWRSGSHQLLTSLLSAVRELAFSPDGRHLASAGDDSIVRIWDPRTGECVQTLTGHMGSLHALTYSPDGMLLASGGRARQIILWDLHAGRAALNLQGPGEMIFSLAFSPDGRTLYSCGTSTDIGVHDLTYYDRHLAGNVEHQLSLRSDGSVTPTHAAAMRAWSAAVLGGADAGGREEER